MIRESNAFIGGILYGDISPVIASVNPSGSHLSLPSSIIMRICLAVRTHRSEAVNQAESIDESSKTGRVLGFWVVSTVNRHGDAIKISSK